MIPDEQQLAMWALLTGCDYTQPHVDAPPPRATKEDA